MPAARPSRFHPPRHFTLQFAVLRARRSQIFPLGGSVSPILVRPVREQLEHDRVIRLLQAKSRRRYEAGINPGAEQNVAVGTGPSALYPDVVLQSTERGHRLQGVVEVETGESVNHLEALAQWAHFARLKIGRAHV